MGATTRASIVVGTDGSASATEAVRHAAQLARSEGALLHVVTAVPRSTEADLRAASKILERTADELAEFDTPIQYYPIAGTPADALVELAAQVDARFVVVGNRGTQSLVPWRRQVSEEI